MSDRRRFLKGLTSLPLATVLASPRFAAAVSAGLQEVEVKLADGRTVKAALATPQGQAKGSLLLIHEWWGASRSDDARRICGCVFRPKLTDALGRDGVLMKAMGEVLSREYLLIKSADWESSTDQEAESELHQYIH